MKKGNYSSDKPITSESEDAFNRSSFAKQLADTIVSKELGDGYVIGLYSEWGYGKTSTLNMIEEELKKTDSIVLVKFNPWLFTDQNTMIKGLFDTLAEALDKKLANNREKFGEVLKKYSSVLAPIPYAGADTAGKTVGAILSHASLDELKARAESIIRKSNKRLIVVIDDVDRLDKDELFQLFKLIKIAVDFKNVVYLIAFDDKVVSDALGERFPNSAESGQSFMEKIIQIPLHLPLIEQDTLNTFVLTGIDDLLTSYKFEIDDDEVRRFREMFDEYISGSIRTPRMANRYLNSLKFILPLTGKEINLVDLLIVEAIRMLYPEEYKKMRLMKKELSGMGREAFMDEKDARAKLKKEVEELVGQKHKLQGVIAELFPSVDNAFKEWGQSYEDSKQQKKLKRVSSPDYFDRYFTYGIPMGDVSDVAILNAINLKDSVEQAKAISELIKGSSPEIVIKKFRSYENDVVDGRTLVESLIKIGTEIYEPRLSGFMDTPLEETAKMMLVLISKLKNSDKIKTTEFAINNIQNVDQLAYFLRWIGIMSDPKKQDKVFEPGQEEALKKVAAVRIATLVKKAPLHKSGNRIGHFLYHNWVEVDGKDIVSKELIKSIKTYTDVCEFLSSYASVLYGSGAPKRGDINGDTYAYLIKIIDPDHLFNIIKKQDVKLTQVTEYPDYQDKVNIVGKENTKAFKDAIARQFAYTHLHYEKPKTNG